MGQPSTLTRWVKSIVFSDCRAHLCNGWGLEAAVRLRFLGIYPNTPDDGSPTIWLDEDTGDLVIQSYKADNETLRHCREVGSVPGTRRMSLRTRR